MELKKLSMYCILASLTFTPVVRIDGFSREAAWGTAGVTSLLAFGLGIWAFNERAAKNKIQADLSGRNSIVQAGEHIKCLEHEYSRFFSIFKNSDLEKNEQIKLFIGFMEPNLNTVDGLKNFGLRLSSQLQRTIQLQKQLELLELVLKQSKGREGELAFIQKVLIPQLFDTQKNLESLNNLYCQNTCSLQLSIVLKQLEQKYSLEQSITDYDNGITSSEKLNSHIRTNYNQAPYQFPFINYVESVKRDMFLLQEAYVCARADNSIQVEDTLKHGQRFLNLLDALLNSIARNPFYIKETEQKPEFDRQEERLKIELRERQARIEREKQATEIRLQHERNRAQELANAARDVELKIKEIARQKETAVLEEARIKDGKTVQEAVAQKEKEWDAKYKKLQSEQQEVAQNIKNLTAHNIQLSRSLTQAGTALQALMSKLQNLPFNPHAVDWLPGYLQDLKKQTEKIAHALQIEGSQVHKQDGPPGGAQIEGETGSHEPA